MRQIKAYCRLKYGLDKKESKKEDWSDDEKPIHPPTIKPMPESEPHMLNRNPVKTEIKQEVKAENPKEETKMPTIPPKPEWTGNPDDWDSYAKACAEWALKVQASPVSREMKDTEKRARA
jgi:hypothetical protein